MKYFLHGINDWLKSIFEQDIATKGRTNQFRAVVAMLIGLVIFSTHGLTIAQTNTVPFEETQNSTADLSYCIGNSCVIG